MGKYYLFILLSLVALIISPAWADEVTFTTYYPAPAGVYNQMQANRMAIGDTNNDTQLTAADLPNRDGDLRLAPQTGDPTAWSSGEAGQFAYSSANDALYHYNGSSWVTQGGGGGGKVLYLACPWGSDFRAGANKGWGNQCGADGLTCCVPASCPSGWTSVGTSAEPVSVVCSSQDPLKACSWAAPIVGGLSYVSFPPVTVGRTVRVCVK